MIGIDDLIQRVVGQRQYLTALENLLRAYPSQQDLFKLLVVNHESDRHERHLLERFDKARHSRALSVNYRLIMAGKIQTYWNQWLTQNQFDFWVDVADENTLELLGTDQMTKVEINGWQVIAGIRLSASKPMQISRRDFLPRVVYLPLAWQGSRECKDVVHAKIEWQIWGIHDQNQKYIQLGGRIVNADRAYQEIFERYRSKSWFWRQLHKLPDKDEWLKSQRKFEKFDHYHGFKDEALKHELLQDDQLQVELLKALMPATESLQKQLNYIWHEQLNYPAIEFGKTGLDFENRKEFL